MGMNGRTIPAIAVIAHIELCIHIAAKNDNADVLRALIGAAQEMGLIKVHARDKNGKVLDFTWLAQPQT